MTIVVNQPAFAQTESSQAQPTNSESIESIERSTESQPQQNQATETEQTQTDRASQPVAKPRTYTRPPNPYDMEAMEKYDEELYGAGR